MNKFIIALLTIGLVACGAGKPELEGKYISKDDTLDFKGNGKVYYIKSGLTKEFTYALEGDKIKVTGARGTAEGTINKDGSVDLDDSHYVKDTAK
jgi:hypothetical protein